MLLEALLALTMLPREAETAGRAAAQTMWARLPTLPAPDAAPALPPSLSLVARAVSNWREQAGENLAPASLALVVRYAATEPGFVARCVRLNNYWCVKQARWSGELGGDAEGHTGFATAADGADAAAQLLRRYYRDYGRRSALAIVRRWAPAECGAPRPVARAVPRAGAGPAVSAGIAPQGIGRTLRARFLARHGRGGVARAAPVAGGLRVQPWSARARLAGHPGRIPVPRAAASRPPLKPVAAIATGLSAAAAGPTPRAAADPATLLAGSRPTEASRLVAEAAALPPLASLPKGSLLDLTLPAPLCASDETRIRNYAARIAASAGVGPEDDLRLFGEDGRAGANLLPVMRAMSAVELGTLHASRELIAAAVARLRDRPTVSAASEPPIGAAR